MEDIAYNVADGLGLTNEESKRLSRFFIKGGDTTKWGVIQAVTALANEDSISADKKYDLQVSGDKLLNVDFRTYDKPVSKKLKKKLERNG